MERFAYANPSTLKEAVGLLSPAGAKPQFSPAAPTCSA